MTESLNDRIIILPLVLNYFEIIFLNDLFIDAVEGPDEVDLFWDRFKKSYKGDGYQQGQAGIIKGDVTLPHEGLPHGVPSSYDWSQKPRRGARRPPEGWTAAIAWGQLYEWIEGNPATNTRVQIRDMEMLYLSRSDGKWHQSMTVMTQNT